MSITLLRQNINNVHYAITPNITPNKDNVHYAITPKITPKHRSPLRYYAKDYAKT